MPEGRALCAALPFHAMLNGIGIGIGIGIGVGVSVGIGIGIVIGTESSIAHCGPMLKISWRSIKIWLRYEGLKSKMPTAERGVGRERGTGL